MSSAFEAMIAPPLGDEKDLVLLRWILLLYVFFVSLSGLVSASGQRSAQTPEGGEPERLGGCPEGSDLDL